MSTSPDISLVPLADRLRMMQWCRYAMGVAAILAWFAVPSDRGQTFPQVAAETLALLALTTPSVLAHRLSRRSAVAVLSTTLLIDGIYLAGVSYATSSFTAPTMALVLVHVIAVTLSASFRTGLKLAVWHSMLMSIALQFQHDGITHPAVPASGRLVGAMIGAVWLVTFATAAFASVNERELRRRNFDLAALAQLSYRLEESLRPEQVAEALTRAVVEDFGVRRVAVVAAPAGAVRCLAGQGLVPSSHAAPADDFLIQSAMRAHRTIRAATVDPARDPWLCAAMPSVRRLLVIPLWAGSAPVGALAVEYDQRQNTRVERRVVSMLERYASQASLALDNAWLLARVRELASTDMLTGLANRRTFDEEMDRELTRAARSSSPLSLLMVDIDFFKRINDTYGHQTGDETLRTVAQQLRSRCRDIDVIARYGGEEFAVVLPMTDTEGATRLAESLRVLVQEHVSPTSGIRVTVSLGVATYPVHARDVRELIAAADAALYTSKESGRNRWTVARPLPPRLAATS